MLYQSSVFLQDVTIHHVIPVLGDASVFPASQVRLSAMFVLRVVGSRKVRVWGNPQWHNVQTKFHQNPSSVSRIIRTDGRTRPTQCMGPFRAHHATNELNVTVVFEWQDTNSETCATCCDGRHELRRLRNVERSL